jgi:hypothetical protein
MFELLLSDQAGFDLFATDPAVVGRARMDQPQDRGVLARYPPLAHHRLKVHADPVVDRIEEVQQFADELARRPGLFARAFGRQFLRAGFHRVSHLAPKFNNQSIPKIAVGSNNSILGPFSN